MIEFFLKLKSWLVGAVVVASAGMAMGQAGGSAAGLPPQTVEAALHAMSDAAGVIFSGRVMRVRQVAGSGGTAGVVEVTFQVDQAVKGCTTGGIYVLREWAGLWSGGNARYRVGQRLLMLLRTPGAAGLSSPVGGMDGAIPIRGGVTSIASGQAVAGGASVAASGVATAAGAMVDLRWVGARMLRDAPYMITATGATVSATTVEPGGSGTGTTAAASASGSVAAAGTSVDTVMGMLSGWEAEVAAP